MTGCRSEALRGADDGRVGVDVYPSRSASAWRTSTSFGKYLGGSATNVAVAAARHGRRSAVITRTGDDPFGRFIHQALRGFGVDDRFVTAVAGLPTPVDFCEIFPPDDFPLYFYREPKAPDLEIHADELDLDAIGAADIFWVTGTGLSRRAVARGHHGRAGGARATSTALTVLDLDYRPMFWALARGGRTRRSAPRCRTSTVAVGNLDECEVADRRARARARPPRRCSTPASRSRSSSRARRACSA